MIQPETVPFREQKARGLLASPIKENPGEVVAMIQGGYFLLTGIWPLLSIRTFMAITGPKIDTWLVKTVGVVVAATGAAIGAAALRGRISREIHLLGALSAAGLAGIDVFYALRRRISPIYLLDAVAEAGIFLGWVMAWLQRSRASGG